MSRTLFAYIFKDLLRIFLLTTGALAGIMSFGGLLRPLSEHGLDASQAAKMLGFFMPAMTTYSLPIAALFATTVVYGRLAADNEITAMRAAGIAYHPFGGIGTPAFVLGLIVALTSLLFLCFIVPNATLKVERVIYSNLAQLISNQIERTHQIKFKQGEAETTIFAQEAAVGKTDPKHPRDQTVTLGGLMIVSYRKQDSVVPNTAALQVPRDFYLAKQATIYIRRSSNDQYTLEAKLDEPGGAMFPRTLIGGSGLMGGVRDTQYGPIVIDSLIREETKFMDIRRLHELYRDLGKGRKVQEQIQKIVRLLQEAAFLNGVASKLQTPGGMFRFEGKGEQYDLISPTGNVALRGGRLVLTPGKLVQNRDGKADFTWDAAEIELSAAPLEGERMSVKATLRDVTIQTPEGPSPRTGFARQFDAKMPAALRELEDRGVEYYRTAPNIPTEQRMSLNRELIRLGNGIQSEMHSRASFAVSCLILVVVGCSLGMMFKSGNFLTAFAISVAPALVCIALIVAGQHTCENVPQASKMANFQNPLTLGLALIWSGNAAVLALAVTLGLRMQRQ